jgi:hypothetical protein
MATPPLPSDDPPSYLSATTMPPLYDYLQDYSAIICRVCKVAVPGHLAQQHLQEVHQLAAWDRCLQLHALPRGVRPWQDHTDFLPLPPSSEPIPQLPIHCVWCCFTCGAYLSSSTWWVREHYHQDHPGVCLPLPWQVSAQRWFANSCYCRYWIVGVPSAQL